MAGVAGMRHRNDYSHFEDPESNSMAELGQPHPTVANVVIAVSGRVVPLRAVFTRTRFAAEGGPIWSGVRGVGASAGLSAGQMGASSFRAGETVKLSRSHVQPSAELSGHRTPLYDLGKLG